MATAEVLTPAEFAAALRGMGVVLDVRSLGPIMPEIENVLMAKFAKNFQLEQTADGTAWPARKDPVPQHPLLNLTGALLDSVTSSNAAHHVAEYGDRYLVTGTDIAYAATHQYGDPSRNIAQREFLNVDDATLEEVEGLVGEWLHGELLGVGG